MATNTTHKDAAGYPIEIEFWYYHKLPEPVRKVFQDAPFNVSAADMFNNRPVMKVYHSMGPKKFAAWLEDQLWSAYRNKISA